MFSMKLFINMSQALDLYAQFICIGAVFPALCFSSESLYNSLFFHRSLSSVRPLDPRLWCYWMSRVSPDRRIYTRTPKKYTDVACFSSMYAIGSGIPIPSRFTLITIWLRRLSPIFGWSSKSGRKSSQIAFSIGEHSCPFPKVNRCR